MSNSFATDIEKPFQAPTTYFQNPSNTPKGLRGRGFEERRIRAVENSLWGQVL